MSRGSRRLHSRCGATLERTSALRIKIFVMVFSLWGELDVFVPSFGILEDFAFVIADDDFFVVVIENVTGIDRHFSAATRGVDDKLRHSVAGGVPAQAFDDLDAFGDGGAQVR